MPGDYEPLISTFDGFQKRSGLVVPFSQQKIEWAVDRAVDEVSRRHSTTKNEGLACKVAGQVVQQLSNPRSEFFVHPDEHGKRIPSIEDVQDLVEILLAENGETLTVAAYKRYRKQRQLARRNIRVRETERHTSGAPLLLVESASKSVNLPWDRKRIVTQIIDKTDLCVELAINIAKNVENRIIASGISVVNTTLVRELVNNELMERGYSHQLRDLSLYRISKDYLEQLMSTRRPGIQNSPEAVNRGIAQSILKQWALDTIYQPEVKHGHDTGAIHIHSLDTPTQAYSAHHSIEQVKKQGLSTVTGLGSASKPARTAGVLSAHLRTFLSSMDAYVAGPQALSSLNVLYAPYLTGMDEKALYQAAQELVFSGSRPPAVEAENSASVVFHLEADIPHRLKDLPVIGPGGCKQLRLKDGSVVDLIKQRSADETTASDNETEEAFRARGEKVLTYGDYAAEANAFGCALLAVMAGGDASGRRSGFPTCVLHVNEAALESPQQPLLRKACELASSEGLIRFSMDRASAGPICSRRQGASPIALQKVSINLPQAAYRAARIGGDVLSRFYNEVEGALDLAVEAHLQKKEAFSEMMKTAGHPLWAIGQADPDGSPYMDPATSSYLLGLIGLNDAVHFLIGQELHTTREAQRFGLKIAARIHLRIRKLAKKYALTFLLDGKHSAPTTERLAQSDAFYFAEESRDIIKGVEGRIHYTDSTELAKDAELAQVERVAEEAKYHNLMDQGASTQLSLAGEDGDALFSLIHKAFFETRTAEILVSVSKAATHEPSVRNAERAPEPVGVK